MDLLECFPGLKQDDYARYITHSHAPDSTDFHLEVDGIPMLIARRCLHLFEDAKSTVQTRDGETDIKFVGPHFPP